MDKGGRRKEGRSQSKRTRTTQALTTDGLCPFTFTVKWDFYGFYITVEKVDFGCPNHGNHLKGDLSKLALPMQLIPEKEKEMLRSMAVACIEAAVGQNYVFSKLGNFITKSQIAYFSSKPSSPLSDGVKKSDTDSLLEFFEETKEILYQTLWDVPLSTGNNALISSLNVNRTKGFAKINQRMILISLYPKRVPRYAGTIHAFLQMRGFFLLLLGLTSMTFVPSCYSQKFFMPTAPVIPTTRTTIC
jgi:hypothetical protein